MAVIEQIAFYNTWSIRHAVLNPDLPFDKIKLEEDEQGIHFGLFEDGKLITVVSTFIKGDELQFRKFATLAAYQHKGYGAQMLQHIIDFAKQEDIQRIWCNARVSAAAFYAKFGFSETEERSTQNDIEFVVMELRL